MASVKMIEAIDDRFTRSAEPCNHESSRCAYILPVTKAPRRLGTRTMAVRPRTVMLAPIFRSSSTCRNRCSKTVSVIVLAPFAIDSSTMAGAWRSVAKPGCGWVKISSPTNPVSDRAS
jgi:hypothetical protein